MIPAIVATSNVPKLFFVLFRATMGQNLLQIVNFVLKAESGTEPEPNLEPGFFQRTEPKPEPKF
jgi:hypothetical protein